MKTGWVYEDAIHCRTRALLDNEMIFISLKRILPEMPNYNDAILHATIIDYRKNELDENSVTLFWRIQESSTLETISMSKDGNANHWFVKIPKQEENTKIEYFINVRSKSGKIGRKPITAPLGYYSYKYVLQNA